MNTARFHSTRFRSTRFRPLFTILLIILAFVSIGAFAAIDVGTNTASAYTGQPLSEPTISATMNVLYTATNSSTLRFNTPNTISTADPTTLHARSGLGAGLPATTPLYACGACLTSTGSSGSGASPTAHVTGDGTSGRMSATTSS